MTLVTTLHTCTSQDSICCRLHQYYCYFYCAIYCFPTQRCPVILCISCLAIISILRICTSCRFTGCTTVFLRVAPWSLRKYLIRQGMTIHLKGLFFLPGIQALTHLWTRWHYKLALKAESGGTKIKYTFTSLTF